MNIISICNSDLKTFWEEKEFVVIICEWFLSNTLTYVACHFSRAIPKILLDLTLPLSKILSKILLVLIFHIQLLLVALSLAVV